MSLLAQLQAEATAFLLEHPENRVQPEDAIHDGLIGMVIYDAPVFAVGAADDPLFVGLRRPEAVHPGYMLPKDWQPGAKSVVSFFAPYTKTVREANARAAKDQIADEWMHARIEGEMLLAKLRLFVRDWLVERGYPSVAPMHDERYGMLEKFAPNWSERHTGYVCGLGTFGLSKGLITEKGVAGRLGSVVTQCELPVTVRTYQGLYDHCNNCGLCARHCPVEAIDPARGMHFAKAHPPCSDFLRLRPPEGKSARQRYGCGKCQVAVPCEHRNPTNKGGA